MYNKILFSVLLLPVLGNYYRVAYYGPEFMLEFIIFIIFFVCAMFFLEKTGIMK